LSSLGWAASFNLKLLDTPVVLRVDTPAAADGVGRLLENFISDESADTPQPDCFALVDGDNTGLDRRAGILLAYRNSRVIGGGDTWADAFAMLMATLNRKVIEEYRGFALHAGVVASEGKVIGFPADSGGGKSTLTAACLAAGFDYVSDESLCIDVATGSVVPYAKPLGLSRWSREQLGVDEVNLLFPSGDSEGMVLPADLGGSVASDPLELNHLVISEYGPEGKASLAEAPGHVAMAALLEFSFNHFKHGERAFTLAAQLANQVEVWQLEYSDPVAAAALLKQRLT
jgi:hypothetical protein